MKVIYCNIQYSLTHTHKGTQIVHNLINRPKMEKERDKGREEANRHAEKKREISQKNFCSRVKKAWWMDRWLDTGKESKGELFTIPKGNIKTMDLSINKAKQRQAYKITLYFLFSHSSPSCLFSLCILPETW